MRTPSAVTPSARKGSDNPTRAIEESCPNHRFGLFIFDGAAVIGLRAGHRKATRTQSCRRDLDPVTGKHRANVHRSYLSTPDRHPLLRRAAMGSQWNLAKSHGRYNPYLPAATSVRRGYKLPCNSAQMDLVRVAHGFGRLQLPNQPKPVRHRCRLTKCASALLRRSLRLRSVSNAVL